MISLESKKKILMAYTENDLEKLFDLIEEEIEKSKCNDDFEETLDNFDFDKVHTVMEYLDWTWINANSENKVPTVKEMKEHVRTLYERLKNSENIAQVSSGGFRVSVDVDDDEQECYVIEFILEES